MVCPFKFKRNLWFFRGFGTFGILGGCGVGFGEWILGRCEVVGEVLSEELAERGIGGTEKTFADWFRILGERRGYCFAGGGAEGF
jgi:hypothetical protein